MLVQSSGNQVFSSEYKPGLFVQTYDTYFGYGAGGANPVTNHRDFSRTPAATISRMASWPPQANPTGTVTSFPAGDNPAQNIMLLEPTEPGSLQGTPYFGYSDPSYILNFHYRGDMGEKANTGVKDRSKTFDHYNWSTLTHNMNVNNYHYYQNDPYTYGQQEALFPEAMNYQMMVTGYLRVPAEAVGTWRFTVGGDDDAGLWVGQSALPGIWGPHNVTVDALLLHGNVYDTRLVTFSTPGYYPIRAIFAENGGGDDWSIEFMGPGISPRNDGTNFFFSRPTATGF
jgi:hypothetical protein